MTRHLISVCILTPALLLTGPTLFAQTTPIEPTAQPQVTTPVMQPEPVVVPVPTPPVITPPTTTPPIVKTPPAPAKKTSKKAAPGDKLKPGQYIWENRTAYKNPLRIIAVLDFQRLYVFDGEELVAFSTISTGKKGHETPSGVFKILQKEVEHYSNLYNNAPMPFMQRLTWDGVALHAGVIPGYAASHGCIRLPAGFAKSLFGVTKLAQEVIVIRDTSMAGRIRETPNEQSKGGEAGIVPPPVETLPPVPPVETPPAQPPVSQPEPAPGL
jgi:lipoprotein-anchoring transpeptidase ErfK/SrfK